MSASDDGEKAKEEERAALRAVVRESLEELRGRMERDGRVLYEGRWRTREEIIGTLKWQTWKEEFAWLRDIALTLLISTAIVVLAYQLLFFLFP